MKINERIRARRRELGMTADELAKAIGKNRATVYRYENTDIESMPVSVLEPIAKALRTTPASLMGWEELRPGILPLPPSKKYRVLGTIACGTPIEAVQESGEEFDFPEDVDADADVCLRCAGDSMLPVYRDGDIVFIRRQPSVENGQIAAVYVKSGSEWDVTLKKVILYPDRDIVILRALNPDFEDMIFTGEERSQLEIYGLAVALYRKT